MINIPPKCYPLSKLHFAHLDPHLRRLSWNTWSKSSIPGKLTLKANGSPETLSRIKGTMLAGCANLCANESWTAGKGGKGLTLTWLLLILWVKIIRCASFHSSTFPCMTNLPIVRSLGTQNPQVIYECQVGIHRFGNPSKSSLKYFGFDGFCIGSWMIWMDVIFQSSIHFWKSIIFSRLQGLVNFWSLWGPRVHQHPNWEVGLNPQKKCSLGGSL